MVPVKAAVKTCGDLEIVWLVLRCDETVSYHEVNEYCGKA